jgi:hypothetical protein
MAIIQEASAPSVEEMRTLFFPEWAMEESSAKSAFGRQVAVVQPLGMFPSTSSKEELTTTDLLWAEGAVSLEAAAGSPFREDIRIRAEKTQVEINFRYRMFPPFPIPMLRSSAPAS